jgi:hypothetical protein
VIEPRNFYQSGADVVLCTEGHIARPAKARGERSAGVEESGMPARVAQEPGRSRALHSKEAEKGRRQRNGPGPVNVASTRTGSELNRRGVEPRSEGNEAKRGAEKSEPLSSTGEVGEPTPGDPMEGRQRSG